MTREFGRVGNKICDSPKRTLKISRDLPLDCVLGSRRMEGRHENRKSSVWEDDNYMCEADSRIFKYKKEALVRMVECLVICLAVEDGGLSTYVYESEPGTL
jgi:hypothetical protein